MIVDEQKNEIARLIELEAENLGSWKKAATKLGANQVTIRYNMIKPELWHLVSEAMWVKVAGKLNYKINDVAWKLVPTTNSRVMFEYLDKAQNEQLFMAISHDAGHGKSAGVAMYRLEKESVFYLECEESWSHKRFVEKLAESLGLPTYRKTVSDLTDRIVHELRQKAATTRPLLIIDEANKLKPSSLRLFIPLFNHLQDEVGMVLIGAHDLRKHIQSGVKRDARGFDELESRLGRSYMPLVGILEADVKAICAANGLSDADAQERVWRKMRPERQLVHGEYRWMATNDLRVLKQAVKYERNRLRIQATVNASSQEGAFAGKSLAVA